MNREKYAYILLLVLTAVFIFCVATRNNTFEDVDYLGLYTGGEIVNNGDISRLYDFVYCSQVNENIRTQNKLVSTGGFYAFMNPPVYALLMSPLAKIPYLISLNIWRMIGIIIFFLCTYLLAQELGINRKWYSIAVVGIVSYPAFAAIKFGQNSFISLGIYTAVFLLLKRNQNIPAGLVLSIGLLKPQMFWCLPIVLIMMKKYKAFAGFVIGSIIFAAANYFYFGNSVIVTYISLLTSNAYREAWKTLLIYMHSIPAFFGLAFGVDQFIVACITAVLVLCLMYRAVRLKYSFESIYAMTIIGTVLASPHLFHYDLLILFIPCLILFRIADVNKFIIALFVLLWISSIYIFYLPLQFSVIVISILFFLVPASHSVQNKLED